VRPSATGSPVEDIAYLTRADHRVATLSAMTVRPRSRSELVELTGVSSSTIRRTLREFEELNWIRRVDYRYETTLLGSYVASGLEELIDRVETERTLRNVWPWLPEEVVEFAFESSADATVTVAEREAPYRPVNRFASLLEAADSFRFLGVDIVMLEPCREEFRRRVLDGMRAEIVNPPSAAEYIVSTYPTLCSEILESETMTALVHDDVPSYGISLFDDRVGVNGYDPDSGAVKVFVDTDCPETREWAESVYATYRSEARPLQPQRIVG
jgi:predicted transcriptional regulator